MGTLQLLSPGFKTLGFGFILKSYSKGTGFDCFFKITNPKNWLYFKVLTRFLITSEQR